jgi:AcrR family transcriptional regulator
MQAMGPPPSRRTRKRLATRQAISDAATRLFFEHGFDRVTVDQIAEAADVGRMTVFNHFPRKEDMFFDREQEARDMAFDAVSSRPPGISPVEALGALAHRLVEQRHPSFPLFEETKAFVETALASEPLKARARQMRDDFVSALAEVLAGAAGRPHDDAEACLAAGLIASAWSIAFTRAHALLTQSGDADAAKRLFLDLVDRGVVGTRAALFATPYA